MFICADNPIIMALVDKTHTWNQIDTGCSQHNAFFKGPFYYCLNISAKVSLHFSPNFYWKIDSPLVVLLSLFSILKLLFRVCSVAYKYNLELKVTFQLTSETWDV